MTKLIASASALMMLSIPAAAFGQDKAPRAAPQTAFRASLDNAAVRAIDSKEIERLYAGQGSSRVLKSLHVSLIALNVMDIVTTRKALARGGVEANPVMKGVVGSRAAFYGVKAVSATAMILMGEKLAKRSRKAAVISAIAANVLTATVVAHNMRQLNR